MSLYVLYFLIYHIASTDLVQPIGQRRGTLKVSSVKNVLGKSIHQPNGSALKLLRLKLGLNVAYKLHLSCT